MPDVQINNLRVRLRGVSPGTAQAAIAQLQGALQTALQGGTQQARSTDRLDLGTLHVGAKTSAEGIAGALADRIAAPLMASPKTSLT